MSEEISNESREDFMVFQTIRVRKEGTVLFAEISSPPMNLLGVRSLAHRIGKFPAAGHVVVKERVNAIALATVGDFRRDSDLFAEGMRNPEAQSRIQAAMKLGFQTRDAEMALASILVDAEGR